MTRYLALATLGLSVLGTDSIAQTAAPATVKLQVVISRYEGERNTGVQPFDFRLALNQAGSLWVGTDVKDLPPAEQLPCVNHFSGTQQVGTKVEPLVRDVGGEFSVALTITERTLAGCRTVGNIDIPIFSNRVVAHTLRLKLGEKTESVFGTDIARNTSSKVAMTLVIAE
jgi:hypothetical protein